jgi:hypothetical protein
MTPFPSPADPNSVRVIAVIGGGQQPSGATCYTPRFSL